MLYFFIYIFLVIVDDTTDSYESIIYKSLVPSIITLFQKSNINPTPGSFYILRMDPRTVIIQVIEKWNDEYVVIVKGLEFQGTSCHSLEVTRVDDIFRGGGSFLRVVNPVHKEEGVEGIMENINSVHGVLDVPENLNGFQAGLLKVLVWSLCKVDIGDIEL